MTNTQYIGIPRKLRRSKMLRVTSKHPKGDPILLPVLPPSKKINIYDCGTHENVTVDRWIGTTPMILKCPVCGKPATSRWYRVDQSLIPTHEWTQPTQVEMRTMPRQLIDHLVHGGLYLRKIQSDDQDPR